VRVDDGQEAKSDDFSIAQGELLRAARARRQMTLHDVEAVTQGEFKAASLSAYERGERAISVLRLLRIADVYRTRLEELLPTPLPTGDGAVDGTSGTGAIWSPPRDLPVAEPQRLRLDIERLEDMRGPGWDQLRNVVVAIQQRRRGRPGRFLLLRGEDLWIVAAIFGMTRRDAIAMLTGEGLARPA
jgi:transcriptional regulator with XRE-family HTH domain